MTGAERYFAERLEDPEYRQAYDEACVGRVVHCKRAPHDIYIGRPSKWGNPFPLRSETMREAVIAAYEQWLRKQPDLMSALPELRGKVLGCWCAPKPCHGDVLVRLAAEDGQSEDWP